MPTIPSTVEIPIGRFVKYVAIFILIGAIFGFAAGVTAVTTDWPHALGGALWQFFLVDNPLITALAVSIPTAYLIVKYKRHW